MALKNNTWKLNQWYDQNVAGNVSYSGASQLWSWGYLNNYGQLGHNDKVNHSSPKQVGSLTNWATLANTGKNDVLNGAINTSGEMFMWGSNTDGQLAQNETAVSFYSSPVQIPGTTWSVLTLNHDDGALAAKTDGTLWVWGNNGFGNLGLNQPNTTKISSPVQIPGTNWSTNKNHYATGSSGRTYAIKTDGTLWGWGTDNYGRLGLNGQAGPVTTQYRYSSPVQIGSAY
jgi:alpha-tubulin suppressor-like RCC1 family protein